MREYTFDFYTCPFRIVRDVYDSKIIYSEPRYCILLKESCINNLNAKCPFYNRKADNKRNDILFKME